MLERRVDDVQLDHKILVEKIRRMELIREDSAYFCRGQKYCVRPLCSHPSFDRCAGLKIDRFSICSQKNAIFARKTAHQRASDKTAVAGDPDTLSVQIETHPILEVLWTIIDGNTNRLHPKVFL